MTPRQQPPMPVLRVCTGAIALALLAGCGDGNQNAGSGNAANVLKSTTTQLTAATYSAEIRRTAHGIPHIRAANDGGLGFGAAYAYAEDNLCQLADEIVTVNGQRSQYFGADGTGFNPQVSNLQTDYFYKLINDAAAVKTAWDKQPADMRALLEGYVAGYNHYLSKLGAANLPAECRNAAWVRPLTVDDMLKLIRRYAAEGGAGQFIAGIVGAAPPGAAPAMASTAARTAVAPAENPMTPDYWKKLRAKTGSNALALGKETTVNGLGAVVSNPHFPWHGAMRFYQVHLTIPGKVDAMGASLGGLPVVNIGFNKDVAWTHTVNTSAHFTSHLLNLDPSNPTRFMLDGQSQPMTRKTVSIQVKGADGVVRSQSRDFYSNKFGLLAVVPGTLDWSSEMAYTIRDANLDNHRMLEQWSVMNRATSLNEFKGGIQRIVGLPWVNTLAADKLGNTLYLGVTVVPHVSKAKQAQCVPEPFKPLAAQGLFVLSGAYSACDWGTDAGAPQPGIFAGLNLPALTRTDFVQNSNDSAWMSNPKAPLTGFPDIVSIEGQELNGRSRMGIKMVNDRAIGWTADGLHLNKWSHQEMWQLALSNRSYYAGLVKDDLVALCGGARTGTAANGAVVDLTVPCQQLAAWDRTANVNAGIGLPYFTGTWERIRRLPNLWSVPFNPLDPANTPRGLNVTNPNLAVLARNALASAVVEAQEQGWTATTKWGEVQGVQRGAKRIPIHGGTDSLGIYNAIESVPVAPGVREVLYGTSYFQTVLFNESQGPTARALLSYSQSSNPASPFYADQTERFAQGNWVLLPFLDWQVENNLISKVTVSNQ